MSIKFKQPFSCKKVDVKIGAVKTKLIPMWKILRQTPSLGLSSGLRDNHQWTNGWNYSSRNTKELANWESTKNRIGEGFHCYLRKKDAEDALQHMGDSPYASYPQIDYVVVRCYVRASSIVGKGWSFVSYERSDYHGKNYWSFRQAQWGDDYASIAAIHRACTGKAYATAVVMQVYIAPEEFLRCCGDIKKILKVLKKYTAPVYQDPNFPVRDKWDNAKLINKEKYILPDYSIMKKEKYLKYL